MFISENENLSDAGVVRPIGRIIAFSAWRASRRRAASSVVPLHDDRVMRQLIRRAEDVDADAIVAVAYRVEPLMREGGIALERTCVEGIAVRLLTAA